MTNFMEEAVLPFADEKARILDFGSGPVPVLAGLMERRGFAVIIYDKYYAPVVPEGSFDFITSTEVFEHLAEPMQTLLLLKKRLSPGAAISVKTLFRPESDEDFMNWWYREDRTHISFFTSRSFLIMAETAGLSIEFCDHRSIVILRN
nr:class I SAM-dependent methyltransferase [Spirochaeta isovalerica]